MSRRHANFHDPIGLVRRMLASGQSTARAALVREVSRYLLRPLDWALIPWERRRVGRAAPVDKPIVLIVGTPRSGSTLLYQVLAAHLPFSYPSNLTELFSHAPITASARLGRFARRKVDYQSYYGNTGSLGSPSDAFSIWNRWLGTDRYRVPDEILAEAGSDMRSFFAAWGSAFDGPFLNKNNRNSAAVPVLASELSTAKFIVMRRNPLFVAQSLVEARENVQGDRAHGWGLAATMEPSGNDHLSDVADQVLAVDLMLETGLSEIDPAGVLEVGYTDLCGGPRDVVVRVGEWLDLEPHGLEGLRPFVSTDKPRLSPPEFAQLQEAIRVRFPPG